MDLDLRLTRFLKSAASIRDFPPDRGYEIAFAGRSNAGKSSALNALSGVRTLARTSRTPGRTQLINFFRIDDNRRLVDLPGYGYAKVPESVKRKWRGLLEAYLANRSALRGLVIVMDIRHPLTPYDRQLLDWLAPLGVPFMLLLTKADKLSRGGALAVRERVVRALGPETMALCFSATKKEGVAEARQKLADWFVADKRNPGVKGGKHRG